MHGGGLELALVFLLAAVIAVPVFRRFGLGAVLGYLAAGVAVGPYGLRVVAMPSRCWRRREIGVVMMLFVIGLELSPSRLRVMRKPVFGAGGAQVVLSGAGARRCWRCWRRARLEGGAGGRPGAGAVVDRGRACSCCRSARR